MRLRPIIDWAVPIILGVIIGGFIGSIGGAVLGLLIGLGIEAIVMLPLGEQIRGDGPALGWFVGAWVGLILGAVTAVAWTRRRML